MGVHRKTEKVETVLQLIQESKHALSAAGLVYQLKEQMNKTTVYRILDRLENQGIIHSFTGINGLTWYANHKNCNSHQNKVHPHFQCEDCGEVDCLSVDIPIPEIPHLKVTTAEVMLVGKCEKCN